MHELMNGWSDPDELHLSVSQGASVFCIITKLITTENQVQGYCPEVLLQLLLTLHLFPATNMSSSSASYNVCNTSFSF